MRDDADIAEFVTTRSPALLRYATLLTSDRSSAEDLLQDALVRTYESWSRVDNPDAYVRRALYTLSVSRWRRWTRREKVTDQVPETAPTDAFGVSGVGLSGGQGDPTYPAEQQALLQAVATLPMRARTCVVLRYYEDRSDAEIAEILGMSPGAVRTTLTRARQALRAHLTSDEVTR